MKGRTEPEDAEDVEEADLNGRAGSGYILEGQVEGEARTSAMSDQRSSK